MEKEGQAAGPTPGAPGPAFVKDLEDLLVALRRSSKDLSFYPPGHPLLNRSLERAVSQLHAMVGVRAPLALVVSRTSFSFDGRPVGAENQQLASMAAELFVKRVQRIFFAEDVEPQELAAFLQMINSDPKQVFQAGGPAKFLAAHDVRRIQVNEFDFQHLGAASGSGGRGTPPRRGGGDEIGTGGTGGGGQGAGAGGAMGGPAGAGAGEGGGAGPAGQGHGAGAGGSGVALGMTGAPGGATGAAVLEPALAGQGSALQGSGGPGGGAGGGGVASAEAPTEPTAAQMSGFAGALLASMGSQEEQTVEALARRLEAEAASGGVAGYEWAASRLEATAGQGVREDRLAEVLVILRIFLRHRQDDTIGAPIRERAAQAVEAVATEDTAAYLIEHLGSPGVGSGPDLAEVLLGLGAPVIPLLLGRLAAEDQEATRARLVEILGRFREVALPPLTEAVQEARRDLACDLARILGEIGGETGVALLGRLTRHREVQVRAEAARGLARIGGTSAHRLLMQALRDPDTGVVELALGFLGAARVRQAVPAILRLTGQPVLAGSAFTVRKAAMAALGAVGDPASVSTLTTLLYTRTWFRRAAGDELRLAAALALLSMGRPEAREVVEKGTRSRRGDVRRACSAALQKGVPPAPANL
jgi:HEAT repeat protein